MSVKDVANFKGSISAAGTTAATATAIKQGNVFNHIGTCTSAAYGVVLPNIPYCAPAFYHICNHGAANASVFPSNAATTQGSIDGRAAGTAFVIAPNASAMFVATTAGTDDVGSTWMTLGYWGPTPVRAIAAAA